MIVNTGSLIELLPCPFCGTIPIANEDNIVWCAKDGCIAVSINATLAQWNTRMGDASARKDEVAKHDPAVQTSHHSQCEISVVDNQKRLISEYMTESLMRFDGMVESRAKIISDTFMLFIRPYLRTTEPMSSEPPSKARRPCAVHGTKRLNLPDTDGTCMNDCPGRHWGEECPPEQSDEVSEIERVAIAISPWRWQVKTNDPWHTFSESTKSAYREQAKAAIKAMKWESVSPEIEVPTTGQKEG